MPPPLATAPVPITRINRIKDHRVFHDFAWPTDLADFARYNVIYGWNGSGKTTLANLFNLIARRADLGEGMVDFQVNGNAVTGNAVSTAAGLPAVRVFNRDFVGASVFAHETPLGAIYYFGEESVEKQKELDALKLDLAQTEKDGSSAQAAKQAAERRLDDFCVNRAKTIKELLTAAGGGPYNNYNKSDFKRRCEIIGADAAEHLVDAARKAELKQQKDAQPKSAIVLASANYPDLVSLRTVAETRLNTTVVSRVLDHLVQHPKIAEWVKQGLALHDTSTPAVTCEFCRNPISSVRLVELEGHFNDQYERFLRDVTADSTALDTVIDSVPTTDLPDEAKLYEHLHLSYRTAKHELTASEGDLVAYLQALQRALQQKREKPFERLALDPFLAGQIATSVESTAQKRAALDRIVAEHNDRTANFQTTITEARTKLELALAAEAHTEFTTLVSAAKAAADQVTSAAKKAGELRSNISTLERSLVEHLRPAEELNAELCAFLGRSDLKLAVQDTGYTITRAGQPASNLSEGEKTAIAFLYFLKSLQDRAFDIGAGVVVVDDPVSSLDANALFCAFGYLKERTKDAGQLFILTHNFSFFRQVRNWFHHLPGQGKPDITKRPARLYMLQTATAAAAVRSSVLVPLDPLLEQFESEYHYPRGVAARLPLTCRAVARFRCLRVRGQCRRALLPAGAKAASETRSDFRAVLLPGARSGS